MEQDDGDEIDLIEDEQSAASLPKSDTKEAKYADNVYCDIRYNLLLKDLAEGITPLGGDK